jgi:hypothetical protein
MVFSGCEMHIYDGPFKARLTVYSKRLLGYFESSLNQIFKKIEEVVDRIGSEHRCPKVRHLSG